MTRVEACPLPHFGTVANVLFTKGDLAVPNGVATARHVESKARGRRPRYESANDPDGEQMLANSKIGCLGEFAVSVLTGLRWHFRIGRPGGCDVGGDLEVKTRSVFVGSPEQRALAGLGNTSARSFRWQVWRNEIGQRLVAVLAPRWKPEGVYTPRNPRDEYVAQAYVVGWLPITPDLFGGSRHVMISGADLRPIGTLEALVADRTLEERIAEQIRVGGSVAGALRACVRANGTLGKVTHALELSKGLTGAHGASLRVALVDLANALGVTV